MRHTFFVFFLLGLSAVSASAQAHIIPAADALRMAAVFNEGKFTEASSPLLSTSYSAEAFQKFISQGGLVKVRIMRAINKGRETFVIIGYDQEDHPLALAVEDGIPCPPFC